MHNTMRNLERLSTTVQKNCNITDAHYAGDNTMCIYLQKMREYYRWENGLSFTDTLRSQELGQWVEKREQMWHQLEDRSYDCIPLDEECLDPFDTDRVNASLVPEGLVYSAGYGRNLRPMFFLGKLLKEERYQDYRILISEHEYARELDAPPAMTSGDTIFLRRESLQRMLWEQIEEWNWHKHTNAMGRAISFYDFESDIDTALEQMTDDEAESAILHEIGEVIAGHLLGNDWHALISKIARTRAEILARAVRDHLADAVCTLPALLEFEHPASIHFYFANMRETRKTLNPRLLDGYQQWVEKGNLEHIRKLIPQSREHWHRVAESMMTLYRDGCDDISLAIEQLAEQSRLD